MVTKKISVIMSTKDTNEEYLRSAIESILNQTYNNFEFLIVNDGGKRDKEIIESYEDKRIKLINHKETKGLTKSLNELINISTGDYIARMDSDDISLKNRFEKQIRFMENYNINICSTYAKYIGYNNKRIVDIFITPEEKKTELLFYNKIIHSSIMIKKSFINKYNIRYNEDFKYSQDYELWSRICNFEKIYVLPKQLMLYRVHNNQISISKRKEQDYLCKLIIMNNLKKIHLNKDEYVDFIMFITGKNVNKIYETKRIKKFTNTIIDYNDKYKVYNSDLLKKILFYRMLVTSYKNKKILSIIKYMFLCNIITLIIKKTILYIKSL